MKKGIILAVAAAAIGAGVYFFIPREPPDITEAQAKEIAEKAVARFSQEAGEGAKATEGSQSGKLEFTGTQPGPTDKRFFWAFHYVNNRPGPRPSVIVSVGKKGDNAVEMTMLPPAEPAAAKPAAAAAAAAKPAEAAAATAKAAAPSAQTGKAAAGGAPAAAAPATASTGTAKAPACSGGPGASTSTAAACTVGDIYKGEKLRDPFVEPPPGGGAGPAESDETPVEFSIHNVSLKGIMGGRGGEYALLVDPNGNTYILKRGKLYDRRNKPVPGVTGSVKVRQRMVHLVTPDKDVQTLVIGEEEEAQ